MTATTTRNNRHHSITRKNNTTGTPGGIARGPHWSKLDRGVKTPQLLVVDDDIDIQTMIELRLRNYLVDVECGFYGMHGIVEAVKKKPDLIITDLAMPNGSGEYLVECVKNNSQTSEIPIIVLTGMSDPALRQRLVGAGADAFLRKSVPFDELLHEMSRFIDLRKRQAGEV